MIRAWKAFWGSIAAELDRHAAELRTGVTLIEAVAADKFETELRAVVGPGTRRDTGKWRWMLRSAGSAQTKQGKHSGKRFEEAANE